MRPKTPAPTAGDIAWLAAVPTTLLLLAALVVLGPVLGDVLFQPSGQHILPGDEFSFMPEPTEHARYVIALLGPLLISGAVLLIPRTRLRLPTDTVAAAVKAVQVLLMLVLAATFVIQDTTIFELPYYPERQHVVYFTPTTLTVAAAFALLLAAGLRRDRYVARAAGWLSETRWRRPLALAIAVLLLAIWELTAFNTEWTIGAANDATSVNFSYWLDETFSVLNGQPPLVGVNAQYGQLFPYLIAGAMKLTAASLGVYASVMIGGASGAMLAIFALLRRVASSSIGALALFLPFVATSFFMERGPLDDRYSPANLFSLFPVRYGGPYVLAWLLARHLDGARPRHRSLLFLLAGLIAINNVEFGIPCFGAVLALFLWTSPRLTRGTVARLARDAGAGLVAAIAAVSALTLVVAGSLPRFSMLFTFAQRYGTDGFGMLPMPSFGVHLALFATFVAALVLATVRAVRGEERLMTGMLAWSGAFGLGAATYFVGRSHPEVLIDIFSIWSLTLGLLLVNAIRAIRDRPSRFPAPIELALFFGFGLAICSLAQTPTPWSQIKRLGETTPVAMFRPLPMNREIARDTRRGEHVAIIAPLGHRTAYEVGVVDVMPYADWLVIYEEQVNEIVDALRRAGGHKIFMINTFTWSETLLQLQRAGFKRVRYVPKLSLAELSDERALSAG